MVPISSKKSNALARPSTPKAKQPAIGWVLISRAEVAKAEALLNDRQRGVVDELGLLSIHQAFADRLFRLFQRIHTDRAFGGHGIGLVNVQRIVHLHGGRIWVDAAPGAGATFYFTLSAAAQPAAAEPAPQAASL